ncbi:MAG: hypothetical protein OEV76_10940 [Anaerolineae bacterium]|nr:hypothetical protein [Anaerolineae bacterium]
MKRVGIAFALSAALLAFSSPRALAPEPQWAAFSYRGGEERYGRVSVDPLIQVVTQEATTQGSVLLDEHTTVVLEEGSLTVVQQGHEVWSSDPSWDVRRLLAADVNDDEVPEVAFVLWKPFRLEPAIIYDTFGFPSLWEEGSLRNHLFIYGWRDGTWQHLWCSSPVADPIVDLAVGDVDGDGSHELVVLEGSYDAPDAPARQVSTWQWNGWGFTLQWRSPAGTWDHLVLQDVTEDGVLDILVKEPS